MEQRAIQRSRPARTFAGPCLAILILFAVPSPAPSQLDATILTFEDQRDGTSLTDQYAGLTFSNAVVRSAGVSLNEYEFPPRSGTNLLTDSSGPITINFSTPVHSVIAWLVYSVPVTVKAFDASGNLIATATSRFGNDEERSGVAGSLPGEPVAVNAAAGIAKVIVTGSSSGTSFALDDLTISPYTLCDLTHAGDTTITDVQQVANEALGLAMAAEDLNLDGVVNIVDFQLEINSALGLSCNAR